MNDSSPSRGTEREGSQYLLAMSADEEKIEALAAEFQQVLPIFRISLQGFKAFGQGCKFDIVGYADMRDGFLPKPVYHAQASQSEMRMLVLDRA